MSLHLIVSSSLLHMEAEWTKDGKLGRHRHRDLLDLMLWLGMLLDLPSINIAELFMFLIKSLGCILIMIYLLACLPYSYVVVNIEGLFERFSILCMNMPFHNI